MPRRLVFVFILLALVPSITRAQDRPLEFASPFPARDSVPGLRAFAPAAPVLRRSPSGAGNLDRSSSTFRWSADSRGGHLRHDTIIGLATGFTVGFLGGVIGSHYAGCGCSDAQKAFGFGIWFGGIGGVSGAVVGAVIGAVTPVRR